MELYQLEYFLEAARQRSFTRAAERLNLAQAALSEQMRKLEAELGTALFHRGKRATVLTPAGEVLSHHAELLIAAAHQATRAVQDFTHLRAGRLVIASIPSVSACLLPPVIAAFRQQHPLVELSLLEGTSQRIAQWIEAGEAELGIVQLPAGSDDCTATPLLIETFTLLIPKTHRLAGKKHVQLADLSQEGFIAYKGRARDTSLAACRSAGFEPRIVCESSELETIRSLVGAGLGIAILPALACRTAYQHTLTLQLRPAIRRQVALLERCDITLSPAAQQMKRLLKQSCKATSSA
jgi:LysR family transcriptional regulator, hydrogen peroxide-inducible genes activator